MHTKVVSTQAVVAAAAAEVVGPAVVEPAVVEPAVEPEPAAGHRVQLGVVVGLDHVAPAIGSGSMAAEL